MVILTLCTSYKKNNLKGLHSDISIKLFSALVHKLNKLFINFEF